MSTDRTVLIVGAGIAGPALAWWLCRRGLRPTVVERAPGLRPGGQSVDLRGPGRLAVERMGLLSAIRAAGTGERGWAFEDADGRTRAAVDIEAFGGEGPTAELEILRGDLCAILHERTRDDVEYRFGDEVAAIHDDGGRVAVEFAGGTTGEYDLVVGADGIGSATRRVVAGEDAQVIHPLNLYMAYFTIPRVASDDDWAHIHLVPGGRTLMTRPDPHGTTRALLTFRSPPRGYERLDPDGQREVLRRTYAGVGGPGPRLIAALDESPDLYVESIGQVRMPTWTRGRVTLAGDAAHCPSPVTGMGTTLAMTGAYVLAGELGAGDDPVAALARYERVLRPIVERAQQVPPGATVQPRSRWGIGVVHGVIRLATAPGVIRLTRRIMAGAGADPDVTLPGAYPVVSPEPAA